MIALGTHRPSHHPRSAIFIKYILLKHWQCAQFILIFYFIVRICFFFSFTFHRKIFRIYLLRYVFIIHVPKRKWYLSNRLNRNAKSEEKIILFLKITCLSFYNNLNRAKRWMKKNSSFVFVCCLKYYIRNIYKWRYWKQCLATLYQKATLTTQIFK